MMIEDRIYVLKKCGLLKRKLLLKVIKVALDFSFLLVADTGS